MRRRISALILVATATPQLTAQDVALPTLPTVVERLGHYLADYARRLPATIATEQYEQHAGAAATAQGVLLVSEFGIMRLDGSGGWLGLRDVVSVNGKPLAGHGQRLQDLFIRPSPQGIAQSQRIARENARFNVGPIQRTINDPAVVLELLDGRHASRMRFRKTGEDTIDGVRAWAIRFDERQRPTVIQAPDRRDEPATGTAWVEPGTGRLVRAQLVIDIRPDRIGALVRHAMTATIDVRFRDEPRLGFWVPSEMTERYQEVNWTVCSGKATYSDYRTFGVETRILPP